MASDEKSVKQAAKLDKQMKRQAELADEAKIKAEQEARAKADQEANAKANADANANAEAAAAALAAQLAQADPLIQAPAADSEQDKETPHLIRLKNAGIDNSDWPLMVEDYNALYPETPCTKENNVMIFPDENAVNEFLLAQATKEPPRKFLCTWVDENMKPTGVLSFSCGDGKVYTGHVSSIKQKLEAALLANPDDINVKMGLEKINKLIELKEQAANAKKAPAVEPTKAQVVEQEEAPAVKSQEAMDVAPEAAALFNLKEGEVLANEAEGAAIFQIIKQLNEAQRAADAGTEIKGKVDNDPDAEPEAPSTGPSR